ncbi:MAG: ABC transporter ATP-binding protein [Planctomycetes bacterium]|nr:ABC transporter ATP-binding protein [Planctomycetota bacterium]
MTRAAPAISLHHVHVQLTGSEILRGVSCRVPRGCLVALVGPNGAGKSTLLRAACGHVPLSAGQVEIDGQPLHRLSRRHIARSVCLLPQDANLAVPFSVREIVAMGRNPHLGRFQPLGRRDTEIIAWAMRQASVESLADRPVTRLSGGEKQRTLLARCLATEAPTLLLDEPTSCLDILHELEVLELLQQFARQDKTVVAAMHDLNAARRICSHVVLLHEGRVAAQGSPAETLCQDHLERVFGVRVAAASQDSLVFSLPSAHRADP